MKCLLSNKQKVTRNARQFYLCAFNLVPIVPSKIERGSDSCIIFEFESSTKDVAIKEKRERLEGLKKQLKMEKVCWHEDKLRAAFGNDIREDEVVKMIWGVVLELSEEVK